jgi:hypothetical protein
MDVHCPHCGKALQITTSKGNSTVFAISPWLFGFEYRSHSELFSLPLLHIAFGYNPHTGLPRVARGVIAIGNFAFGVVAIGGIAAGGFVLSGIGFGFLTLAGIAVGWVAIGGIAVGAAFALGGLALSLWRAKEGIPLIMSTVLLPSFAVLFLELTRNSHCLHTMAQSPALDRPSFRKTCLANT